MHGHLRCGIRRHGTYCRVHPAGTHIPRWYCRAAHQTFSLLAECFAAHLPGTLVEVEQAVVALERAPSQEAALAHLRTDILLPGALRWARRRLHAVHGALAIIATAQADRFAGCAPTVSAFRAHLGVEPVLPCLRNTVVHIDPLPAPLGFDRRSIVRMARRGGPQQPTGPDPPPRSR